MKMTSTARGRMPLSSHLPVTVYVLPLPVTPKDESHARVRTLSNVMRLPYLYALKDLVLSPSPKKKLFATGSSLELVDRRSKVL